ncbi:cadmium transporter [Sphaerisporangium krabiense]|uniref:Cadmium resistance protein CadD (Predicted permease) n=1 Tax=Sphaerisporangium krabiense TaxID=763782 RepID=A0A7W8Z7L0_9ACTN|nr:cadmium resistance transporter [Sphaerisporangium krabiense]MBB5628938.1 cadmium resistance protein CadD (predicted permease) [Sphaerisporangium krabiense]GII60221.1 cadmium transporter [Sphaerisporangium krabiense]
MGEVLGTAGTAVGMFAGTNVDDIIVLTVLFLAARAGGRPRPWHIWAGQYAGIAALVALSALAALGLTVLPDRWVGLLGLVPLGLGLWGLVRAVRGRGGDGEDPPAVATGPLSVAGVTLANGADNISVYTPVFRSIGAAATVLTVAVFAAGVAVWCLAGSWLGSHPAVVGLVRRHGGWIVPTVFTAIGAVIVLGSGVLGELL